VADFEMSSVFDRRVPDLEKAGINSKAQFAFVRSADYTDLFIGSE
jgi:hypothetical protein